MHTNNYQETKIMMTFKIITLPIQKNKKNQNQNTQYDIIISDLKRSRIRQALS